MEGYKSVRTTELNDGDEVIVERRRFQPNGTPGASLYYRAVAKPHGTVAGPTMILVAEPSIEWPEIAPWALGWIYAGNTGTEQMWRKK